MGKWETPYLDAKVSYIRNYITAKPGTEKTPSKKPDDFRESFVFKNMQLAYGALVADAVLSHLSHTVGKPRSEIVSNYSTFSKFVIQVCGETEATKFLSKIPATS